MPAESRPIFSKNAPYLLSFRSSAIASATSRPYVSIRSSSSSGVRVPSSAFALELTALRSKFSSICL